MSETTGEQILLCNSYQLQLKMPTSLAPQTSGLDKQSTATLLELISKLRQELLQSQSETQKVTDNLNVLITLVKRAWYGEKTATLHLANIVGAPAQEAPEGGRFGNLGTGNTKTRAVSHWERLSIKLLQREYAQVQEEIKRRQMAYLETRHQYMDELIQTHYQDMSRFTQTHGPRPQRTQSASNSQPVQNVDNTFLHNFSQKMKRPPSGKKPARSKSAGVQRSRSKDILQRAEVTLRELVVQPNANLPTTNLNANDAMTGLMDPDPDRQLVDERYMTSYDDPSRYTQSNLFDLDAVFGPESFHRKSRPLSAAFMRERDAGRSRPKSASTENGNTFITQKGERPLKYETTRPVPKHTTRSGRLRYRRHSGETSLNNRHRDLSGSRRSSVSEIELPPEVPPHPSPEVQEEEVQEVPVGPTPEQIAARERATDLRRRIDKVTKRPECVEKFDQELEHMSDMERQFRQSTVQLQRKLGLDNKGLLF